MLLRYFQGLVLHDVEANLSLFVYLMTALYYAFDSLISPKDLEADLSRLCSMTDMKPTESTDRLGLVSFLPNLLLYSNSKDSYCQQYDEYLLEITPSIVESS